MAVYKDEQMMQYFGPQLQPGEQLVHWAYGVKQPHVLLIALLLGGILAAIFTKHYLVGLTSFGRFIVLQMSGKNVKGVHGIYQLGQVAGVKTSTGMLFTHIKIDQPTPFKAKFHRMGMKQNREHSQAMAAALEGRQIAA